MKRIYKIEADLDVEFVWDDYTRVYRVVDKAGSYIM